MENDNLTLTETEERKSDLYYLLDNLDTMFTCYLNMGSECAREAWLVPFCIEVSMVTLKLKAMRKRWQTFLPFQEVIDVKFKEWRDVAKGWLPHLGDETTDIESEYEQMVLGPGHLLDLMGVELEPIKPGLKADELKSAVAAYCKKVDNLLKKSKFEEWERIAINRLELNVQELIGQHNPDLNPRNIAIAAVHALADELDELEEFFFSELKEEQFIILANRLMHRDCQNAIRTAKEEVRKEQNAWPSKHKNIRAMAMRDRVKMDLIQKAKGDELKDYIDLDYPDLLGDACFGQYLFHSRHKLTTRDLELMVQYCTEIDMLNQVIDPTLSIKRKRDAAMGRELDEEEKAIVKKLLAFADKAEWRSGSTADSIRQGINRMLGVGYHLDTDMKQLSEELWKMLKKRRGQDADKSLMLTWLNIVGYCVNRRILTGGSPALCKLFYPHCDDRQYTAIDKGKSEETSPIKKVWPLLDKFFK